MPATCAPHAALSTTPSEPGERESTPKLVGEIARVLGSSDLQVARWEERCLDARRTPKAADPVLVVESEPAHPLPQPNMAEGAATGGKFILFLACIVLNVLGFTFVAWLELPLYLDMLGPALAAILLGPWVGVAVGLSTNGMGGLAVTGSSSIAFALVNIVGALAWGCGARRFQMCRTFPRYFYSISSWP